MCSFEVYHVDVAEKLRKLKGAHKQQLQLMSPQHDVPQKNTFFIENSDSGSKSIVL